MAREYVLVDLEWVDNKVGHCSPTQLAAMRVDENWNPIQTVSTLIRPQNSTFHDWKHVAYTGGSAEDFLMGRSAFHAIEYFEKWLKPDDVICWWYSTGRDTYSMLARRIMKITEQRPSVILSEYLREFLKGEKKIKINSYAIASAKNITVTLPEHCAKNDVSAMQTVLKAINFPQKYLESPPPKREKADPHYLYFLDPSTELLHKVGSDCITDPKKYQKFSNLVSCIKRKLKPCPICMKDEFEQGRKDLCKDIINRCEYNYIYLPNSKIFHRYDCGLIRTATQILGCRDYQKAVASGRTPCKVCHPTPYDKPRKMRNIPVLATLKHGSRKKSPNMSRDERHAMSRLKRSQRDWFNGAVKEQNPGISNSDARTLTNPGFAFWAAKGYQTFHVRNCPNLKGLTSLKGFALYDQAIRAGYTPCKKCKPTRKQDAVVSIPITSKVRSDEKVSDLDQLCKDNGYAYHRDEVFYYIETPVGKWKINVTAHPIQLSHINLVKKWKDMEHYHRQPRAFLSLIDTFFYIRRHDNSIIEKMNFAGIKENEQMQDDKTIEQLTEELQNAIQKIAGNSGIDVSVSVSADKYKDCTIEQLEEMLDDAESEYSDLEDEIDEFEVGMPNEDSPEYAAAIEEFDSMRERLDELEDLIDELEDEISERKDEDDAE